jgi:uncharacterized protein YecE (DUF72 family)
VTERGRARVGCSGWSYRAWRGTVYPEDLPARRWFEHYAGMFDTVELNATFYRLPEASTVETWAEQAPDGFTYAVKVGSYGTHRKHLRDPHGWLGRHLERIDRLGTHLGPNLLQLPPRWGRDVGRLDELLTVAPSTVRWALEVRDRSWLHDDVFDCLARHGAALCVHDLLEDHPWERTADWSYLRFHGPDATERPYEGRYTGRRLWRAADRISAWLDDGCDVYAYFNNDTDGHAPIDATWLRDRLPA